MRNIRTVTIPGEENALPAERIAAFAADARPMPDVAAAVADLARGKPARVLICGSLYLAGRVLGDNG